MSAMIDGGPSGGKLAGVGGALGQLGNMTKVASYQAKVAAIAAYNIKAQF